MPKMIRSGGSRIVEWRCENLNSLVSKQSGSVLRTIEVSKLESDLRQLRWSDIRKDVKGSTSRGSWSLGGGEMTVDL
jgi:hypothetical protein